MGRISEMFRYLETPTNEMESFKFTMSRISITEESKKVRRELKLYKTEDANLESK